MFKNGMILISDLHFSINNLEYASKSLIEALKVSENLNRPLVIAGDLNDTKAIIRAEVANRLIEILNKYPQVKVFILIGNHDLINEKGLEHSLNFLGELKNVSIISSTTLFDGLHYKIALIPYQTSGDVFLEEVSNIPKSYIIICHQGFLGAFMGEYIQDKSSIDPKKLIDYKVYSGHYHRHQKIDTITYIGTSYTTSFSEANDGKKGFLVIDSRGEIENRCVLNIRQHIIITRDKTNILVSEHNVKPNDLLWLKVYGEKDWLKTLDKEELGIRFIGHNNYRLELIPTDIKQHVDINKNDTPIVLLDKIVQESANSEERKKKLNDTIRELLCK